MDIDTPKESTAIKASSGEREAVLGNWIGASVERLRQITGQQRGAPRVRVETVWAALGDRTAPVTIVRWREESRADLVA